MPPRGALYGHRSYFLVVAHGPTVYAPYLGNGLRAALGVAPAVIAARAVSVCDWFAEMLGARGLVTQHASPPSPRRRMSRMYPGPGSGSAASSGCGGSGWVGWEAGPAVVLSARRWDLRRIGCDSDSGPGGMLAALRGTPVGVSGTEVRLSGLLCVCARERGVGREGAGMRRRSWLMCRVTVRPCIWTS